MVVALDNTVLCLLLHPDAHAPNDPATGKPVDRPKERMELLVAKLAKEGARIVIPAPVLSEFLTFASADYLDEINTSKHFTVSAFDVRAAIEAALTLRKALSAGKGKTLGLNSPWQKVKVDRQIIAIAKVEGAKVIYTTDSDMIALAKDSGIDAVHIADLPLPPSKTPLLDTAEDESVAAGTDPEQPQPDSSPHAPPPSPSKK